MIVVITAVRHYNYCRKERKAQTDADIRAYLTELYEMGQRNDAQELEVLLLADNVLSHPGEIARYLKELEALPRFDRVVIPAGKGLSVAYQATRG